MIERFLALAALCLFIGHPVVSLDGRALTAREGHHALDVIGVLEGERRIPRALPPMQYSADDTVARVGFDAQLIRLLGTGAAIFGTSETALRGLCLLGVLLGILVLAFSGPHGGRAMVGLITPLYICPLVLRGDGLEPELWAFLPPALLLSGFMLIPSRWTLSLILYALAGGAAPLLLGRAYWTCLVLLLAGPLLAAKSTVLRATLASSVAATTLILARIFQSSHEPWEGSELEPNMGLRDLLPTSVPLLAIYAALTLATIAVAMRAAEPQDRFLGKLLLLLPVALVANAFADLRPFSLDGTDWVAVLPLLSLILACALWRAPARMGAVLAMGFLGICGLAAWHHAETKPSPPIWLVLDEAREQAEPGGRLILHGPDRYALLYYSKHGHYPNLPILLAPDDGPLDRILEQLPERVSSGRGQTPGILAYPKLLETGPFVREAQTPLGLDRLRLSSTRR